VQRITIAADSTDVMRVTTSEAGADPTNPFIGLKNINQPLGAVQLNAQGDIPQELLSIVGIQVRGPFRGDDLCPKPNDTNGCTFPDTRNPTQRLPDIDFATGDAFIITMEDGETEGTMELFVDVGDPATSIVTVESSDTIIFIDTDEVQVGWYHFPSLVELGSAADIAYSDAGNIYVLGPNVQVALDAIDNHLLVRDNWYLSNRTTFREGFEVANLDILLASGFYVTLAGAAGNPNAVDDFSVIHNIRNTDNMTQIAISHADGQSYSRAFVTGAWTAWIAEFDSKLAGYLRSGVTLSVEGLDLDDMLNNSRYWIGSANPNTPPDFTGFGVVETVLGDGTANANQYVYGNSDPPSQYKTWQRHRVGASWGEWKLIVDGGAFTQRLRGYSDNLDHANFTGDINTINYNSKYMIWDGSTTNSPEDFISIGFLMSMVKEAEPENMVQILYGQDSTNANKIWQRSKTGDVWRTWILFIDGNAIEIDEFGNIIVHGRITVADQVRALAAAPSGNADLTRKDYVDQNFQLSSEKGASNGYCPLDISGLVPLTNLSVLNIQFAGTHDASTGNTPLPEVDGEFYVINIVGTLTVVPADGSSQTPVPTLMTLGDYVLFSGRTGFWYQLTPNFAQTDARYLQLIGGTISGNLGIVGVLLGTDIVDTTQIAAAAVGRIEIANSTTTSAGTINPGTVLDFNLNDWALFPMIHHTQTARQQWISGALSDGIGAVQPRFSITNDHNSVSITYDVDHRWIIAA